MENYETIIVKLSPEVYTNIQKIVRSVISEAFEKLRTTRVDGSVTNDEDFLSAAQTADFLKLN